MKTKDCIRTENTVYSRHVPCKDLAYCILPVKRLLLLQDDLSLVNINMDDIGVIILLRVRCRKNYIFLVFSERKFQKVKRTSLTPNRQPLNRFNWNSDSLLSDIFPWKPCPRFLFSFPFSNNRHFFQRKCWWYISSDFILLSWKEQMHVSKIWYTVF